MTPPAPPIEPSATLSAADLHLVRRFSYGYTPALGAAVASAGGGSAWFQHQLDPAAIADAAADEVDGWWDSLALDAATLWQRDQDGSRR